MKCFLYDSLDLVSKFTENCTGIGTLCTDNEWFYSKKSGIIILPKVQSEHKEQWNVELGNNQFDVAENKDLVLKILKNETHSTLGIEALKPKLLYYPYFPRVNLAEQLIAGGYRVSLEHKRDISYYIVDGIQFAYKDKHPGIIVCKDWNATTLSIILDRVCSGYTVPKYNAGIDNAFNVACELAYTSDSIDILMDDYVTCKELGLNKE